MWPGDLFEYTGDENKGWQVSVKSFFLKNSLFEKKIVYTGKLNTLKASVSRDFELHQRLPLLPWARNLNLIA